MGTIMWKDRLRDMFWLVIMTLFVIFNPFHNNVLNAATLQEDLENMFDIVDTFDNYQVWTGGNSTPASPFITDGDDLPKHLDGTGSAIWKRYAYNPSGEELGEGRGGPWIGDHGSAYQIGSKGLKLSARGFGSLELHTYFGNGNADSGYSEIYLFFRAFFPKNAFPTNTEPVSSGRVVEFNQAIYNSDGYLWTTAWKFLNFGTGFTSVKDHSSGCYYGDGEAWFNLSNTYNDVGQHALFGAATCGFTGCIDGNCHGTTSIDFDTLGAIEVRIKKEVYAIDNSVLEYGILQAWWYDDAGNAKELIYKDKITILQPEDSTHLINRIIINGNKHRYDVTGPPNSPSNLNRSVGEYTIKDKMAKWWYLDDFIIDGNRIGPKYFNAVNTPNPPNPPTDIGLE